ncbi:MAG: UDPGP type 1 family protein [Verrucomicrobiota bacterium]|nr:UDPGP type 1 family protein [Verrucomicrobiota bacterium]
MTRNNLLESYASVGQKNVFQFYDQLDASAQARLIAQAKTIDLAEVESLVQKYIRGDRPNPTNLLGLEPAPYISRPENGGDVSKWRLASATGAAAIQAGRVAAFSVAGGQGTRLGYDGPKGTYPVTPLTGKSLFQVFAEKIVRSSARFSVTIPWFILTSEINNDATISAFEESNFFGLSRDSVHFIVQGLMPAVDYEGKIILNEKGRIAMTPDGHGGSLRALVRSGATDIMRVKGIDVISYFQVDNPIVQCIDPAFIGFHLINHSELSSKMVPKSYALEKVGHFCVQNENTIVVEYSDMPESMQKEINADGSIRFNAGSVAIHIFDRDFIERVGDSTEDLKLPFHRADKKIPYVNEAGITINPEVTNGVKFEMFVFDALPMAKNPVIIEALREDDFSPVKNATGIDSPQTCKEDQLRMFARWLKAAGECIETDDSGLPKITFEISHLFAADESDFISQWSVLDSKPDITEGLVIE